MNDLAKARVAVNFLTLLLAQPDDLNTLVAVGNITAELRNLWGCDFIDWELISGICDAREYAITSHAPLDPLNRAEFNPIINKIEGRCGAEGLVLAREFLTPNTTTLAAIDEANKIARDPTVPSYSSMKDLKQALLTDDSGKANH